MKQIARSLVAGVSACALAGCTTFSFAPPKVETDREITDQRPSDCGKFAQKTGNRLVKDVNGALNLTDNFLRAYRCAAHEAADGRQIFQVPSFLALVTAAIGPTFGLGNDGRIAALAGAGVYGRADAYYAPKEKAKLLDSAIDAVLCVKTESVGAGYFDTRPTEPTAADKADESTIARIDDAIAQLQKVQSDLKSELLLLNDQMVEAKRNNNQAGEARLSAEILDKAEQAIRFRELERALVEQKGALNSQMALRRSSTGFMAMGNGGTVAFEPKRKYFEMVSAALFSIERILADQLSNAGKFDAEGIEAQFKDILKKQEEAQKKLDEAKRGQGVLTQSGMPSVTTADVITLDLDLLQTRLQACVVRAKVS